MGSAHITSSNSSFIPRIRSGVTASTPSLRAMFSIPFSARIISVLCLWSSSGHVAFTWLIITELSFHRLRPTSYFSVFDFYCFSFFDLLNLHSYARAYEVPFFMRSPSLWCVFGVPPFVPTHSALWECLVFAVQSATSPITVRTGDLPNYVASKTRRPSELQLTHL